MEIKKGDFIKLSDELKSFAKTTYDFGKVEKVANTLIDVVFVDEEDVNKNIKLHEIKEYGGLTFSFSLYDVHY